MNVAEAEITHAEELARTERPPRQDKVDEIERLKNVLKKAASVYLTDFRGIDVEKINALRLLFHEAGVDFWIIKNNLLKRAAEGVDLGDWVVDLEGPTAMAVGMEDPIAPAKVIKQFQDNHRRTADLLEFKRGLIQGEAIGVDTCKRLATLPDRDELFARILFMITYPLKGLVTALSAVPAKLVFALDDLRRMRESEKTEKEPVFKDDDDESGDDSKPDRETE